MTSAFCTAARISDGGDAMPAARERTVLATRYGKPADQLGPQIFRLDNIVDDEFPGQPQHIDVVVIGRPEPP